MLFFRIFPLCYIVVVMYHFENSVHDPAAPILFYLGLVAFGFLLSDICLPGPSRCDDEDDPEDDDQEDDLVD